MPQILRGAANAASSPSQPAALPAPQPLNVLNRVPVWCRPRARARRPASGQSATTFTRKSLPLPASHDDDDFRAAQRKMRDGLALVIRRELRHMRRSSAQPRSLRLPKEGRMLKSLLAGAEAAGLLLPEETAGRAVPSRCETSRRGRKNAQAREPKGCARRPYAVKGRKPPKPKDDDR